MAHVLARKSAVNHNATEAATAPTEADVATLRQDVLSRLTFTVAKDKASASQRDWFIATALATRDRVVSAWLASTKRNYEEDRKRVYYLSLEFLVGRLLMDALTNLGLTQTMREALSGIGRRPR